MKNFIFKSTSKDIDLLKILTKLDLLLGEQRHQRNDLKELKRSLSRISPDFVQEEIEYPEEEQVDTSHTEHGK